jgi:putative Mn2+ efflux pump MntP
VNWLNVIGIALGLAMDAFAVSIAAGLRIPRLTGRHVFRLAWHFGLFQFLMPILGWLAGRTVDQYIHDVDHWVAAGLLGVIGGKMLIEAIRGERDGGAVSTSDPTRGLMLVTLSIATSLDAMAVGLSMALLGVSVWGPAVVIGIVAGLLTMVGMMFGSRLGSRFERWAGALGGVVLVGIGVRILVTHVTP